MSRSSLAHKRCPRCGQTKQWSRMAVHKHKCKHGLPCETGKEFNCARCASLPIDREKKR